MEGESTIVPEDVARPTPEVIANPPLDSIKLFFSTPVYKEWKSGHLLRHVRAVLSQKLEPGQSIESNYNVNLGMNYGEFFDQTFEGRDEQTGHSIYKDLYRPQQIIGNKEQEFVLAEAEKMLGFLKDVVEVQRLARRKHEFTAQGAIPEQVQTAESALAEKIEGEQSSLTRDIFHLAAKRCQDVAISGIDSTKVLRKENTPLGTIQLHRTSGLEYATERLTDPDAIFFLNDADTIPGNNLFVRDVLNVYQQDSAIECVFVGLSYQPPGTSQDLAANSPGYSMTRTAGYNGFAMGSPQISCTREALDRLKHISSGMDYEDYTTSRRLRRMFLDVQEGLLLKTQEIYIPTQITSDRPGFVDGAGERDVSKTSDVINESFMKANTEIKELKEFVDTMPEDQRLQIEAETPGLREKYHSEQKKLMRHNRMTVSTFLTAVSSGDIRIRGDSVEIDEAALLAKPFGRALTHYVTGNKELIATLSEADLKLMRYYVKEGEAFPQDILELTPFQISLREYIGDYPEASNCPIEALEELNGNRDSQDKRSIMQPFMAEMLCLGNLIERYKNTAVVRAWDAYGKEDPTEHLKIPPLEKRTGWLKEGFAQTPPILDLLEIERGQRALLERVFPFGKLSRLLPTLSWKGKGRIS